MGARFGGLFYGEFSTGGFVAPGSEAALVFGIYERKYREDQTRDWHGRFAYEGGGADGKKPDRVQVASSDKPTLGRHAMAAIAMELAKRAIAAYRSENGLYDLFKRKDGTVSYTEVNGKVIFESNSTSPTFDASDRAAADNMRDTLKREYPEVFDRVLPYVGLKLGNPTVTFIDSNKVANSMRDGRWNVRVSP